MPEVGAFAWVVTMEIQCWTVT